MIYLDHAATTPLDCDALNAMLPFLKDSFGNPQSQHAYGRAAANAVEAARDKMAGILGIEPSSLYFTSGGSEANATAIKGVAAALSGRGRHLIVTQIEHPSMLKAAEQLQKSGCEVTYLPPDRDGIISPAAVKNALRADTVFVGVMAANNEVGTLQPVEEIYGVCKERGVFLYCDCVQVAGVFPLNMFPCDGFGFSAHKFYGPKGFGGLYMRPGAPFERLITGGMQERGMRGGTTYVAGAIGCAVALEKAEKFREENNKKIAALRDRFLEGVFKGIEGAHLNGSAQNRLPANANLSFDGCAGEQITFSLDLKGVAASTGSACSSGAVTPSRVITAMGLGEERARQAVRFTFGKDNSFPEVEQAVEILKQTVERIRKGK